MCKVLYSKEGKLKKTKRHSVTPTTAMLAMRQNRLIITHSSGFFPRGLTGGEDASMDFTLSSSEEVEADEESNLNTAGPVRVEMGAEVGGLGGEYNVSPIPPPARLEGEEGRVREERTGEEIVARPSVLDSELKVIARGVFVLDSKSARAKETGHVRYR